MTAPASIKSAKRVRASERALKIALKAVQDCGLPVEKLCISGGQIEIHCAAVAVNATPENDEGLEKW